MRLYHATDKKNVTGILRLGLFAGLATGKRKAVWGVRHGQIENAVLHCCTKRRVRLKDVVVLEIDVPDSWVRRFSVAGMVYVGRDIAPERIRVYAKAFLRKE